MSKATKYLSVCSGIEAATCAWHPLGFEPFAFSEIEKFPSCVLANHYPTVPNLGDMTKFEEWPDATIDILVGGTPCQSFSVAGLRKGLADPRGNLMLTYGAIAAKYRPKWLVWENVPGVLSSNGGRDFGTFLGMLGQLGYGFAYRVLDAQFFGVAQRRRRVFVVGCLGDWRSAAAVLFERHSMQGHIAPRREAGKEIAGTVAKCSFSGGAGGRPEGAAANHFLAVPHAEISPAIKARDSKGVSSDGDGDGAILVPMVAPSLVSNGDSHSGFMDEHGLVATVMSVSLRGREGGATAELGDEVGQCLRASKGGGDKPHVLAPVIGWSEELTASEEMAGTIQRGGAGGRHDGVMDQASMVRRLTLIECERLQGFPDDYTLLPGNKADGPRYKALGNSMAVPVMAWIGRRIAAVDAINAVKTEIAA